MAVITKDTFDPLRRYVGVRLQQGVPIVDADWNELDDLLRFESRVFLRWFVGNGMPAGSDAFRVDGAALDNDVVIRRGVAGGPGATSLETGLRFTGRALVDGLSIFIPGDLKFTDQPLHEGKGASADTEAALAGVPKIKAIQPPGANTTLAAYLDVWERLVTPSEDTKLVLTALGIESCARMKREWAVRVRTGALAPVQGDADFIAGHSYLLLATIARTAGQAKVNAADVTDKRVIRLSLSDALTRLATIERLTVLPAFTPAPNEFAPKQGPTGQPIVLKGRNFNLGTVAVQFTQQVPAPVAVTATPSSPPTATQIAVNVPAGLAGGAGAGPVKITVITEGGSVTSVDTFTVM